MRKLEQSLIRTRSVLRRAWSRVHTTDPDLVAPARLVLQLDDTALPGSMGTATPLSLAEWSQTIAAVVARQGPLPVTVLATHSAGTDPVVELVRFAHRLECPTRLITDGSGIDAHRAGQFLDAGLGAVRVLVGGVSEAVQRVTVGNAATDATTAVAVLVAARAERDYPLDIEIDIPWVEGVTTELSAVVGWARQAGADGFRIVAPYRAHGLPADPELLDAIVDDAQGFCRNTATSIENLHSMVAHQDGAPGIARKRRRCPVAGQRVVIGAGRAVYSCPFHAPIGSLDGEFADVWAQSRTHIEAIASCNRACVHTELAPQPIFGLS
jgi:hypothetical protein